MGIESAKGNSSTICEEPFGPVHRRAWELSGFLSERGALRQGGTSGFAFSKAFF